MSDLVLRTNVEMRLTRKYPRETFKIGFFSIDRMSTAQISLQACMEFTPVRVIYKPYSSECRLLRFIVYSKMISYAKNLPMNGLIRRTTYPRTLRPTFKHIPHSHAAQRLRSSVQCMRAVSHYSYDWSSIG